MFGSVSDENVARIKRQNKRKISVIIGNPPYNANQQNENDNNKNRTYPRIDERIKASYIKQSTAQKTKAYDMYTRFFSLGFRPPERRRDRRFHYQPQLYRQPDNGRLP